ncbi:MAG: hypothetical protein JKP98_18060 [Rhodobacteraceae bacterium]|nr:hypothetical protein [Paracoccaceae bacterium]
MGLVDDIVHRAARDVRTDVRKMILPGLLVLAAGLSGAAGMGFLTAWAYLALTAAIGHGPAALLIGLGHALLSAASCSSRAGCFRNLPRMTRPKSRQA